MEGLETVVTIMLSTKKSVVSVVCDGMEILIQLKGMPALKISMPCGYESLEKRPYVLFEPTRFVFLYAVTKMSLGNVMVALCCSIVAKVNRAITMSSLNLMSRISLVGLLS